MKVLHVVESCRGGCGSYLNEIVPLQQMDLGSDNIRVLAPDRHRSHLTALSDKTVFTFFRPGRAAGILCFAAVLGVAVFRFRPDVIHAHSSFAGLIGRLLGRFLWRRAAIVYCPHGWAFEMDGRPRVRSAIAALERFLSTYCDKVVAISEAERHQGEAAGIEPGKLLVVLNGIAATEPCGRPARWDGARRKVLFVGRLDRQKGVDILLEAVRGLEHLVSVRIVGEAVLSKGSSVINSAINVEYLGWLNQQNITRQLRACDVFVVPSRWEGFGLVVIEAMRAGKPVIASAVGGLREIVTDRRTGRLVPAGDPIVLRRVILEHTPDELAEMGRAGRETFLKFYTSDRTHHALMNLYVGLLSARSKVSSARSETETYPVD